LAVETHEQGVKIMAGIKIGKESNLRFDGQWVTNNYWMAKGPHVKVSLKTAQGLIDAGIPFSKDKYSLDLDTGEGCADFDNARIVEQAAPNEADNACNPTALIYEDSNGAYRVCKHASGRVVALDLAYSSLWEGCCMYQAAPLTSVSVYRNDEDLVAIVMPCNVTDDMSRHLQFVATGLTKE